MDSTGKIWPALDCPMEKGLEIAKAVAGHPAVMGFKLNRTGDQTMYRRDGEPHVLEVLAGLGKPVWLDFKFHDVPPTVEGRIQPHVENGWVQYVTVMAKGEVDMMMAAVKAGGDKVSIIAVTELTSNTEEQVHLGSGQPAKASVIQLARNAVLSGVKYLVCSTKELPVIVSRPELAGLTPFVPGIKVGQVLGEGQARTGTPTGVLEACPEAVCVIGSGIVKADDPLAAVEVVAAEIEAIPDVA